MADEEAPPLAKRQAVVARAGRSASLSDGLQRLAERLAKKGTEDGARLDRLVNELFFELANADEVQVEFAGGQTAAIRQDLSPNLTHTGGIVWETSYVLAQYLRDLFSTKEEKRKQDQTLLELGAGCGYLSIALRQCFPKRWCKVVTTEQGEAFANLRENVRRNAATGLKAKVLDWTDQEGRSALGTFDIIVATDVIFSLDLVAPLVRTLRACSSESTIIYLSVQEREADAHAKFLTLIKKSFLEVEALPVQLSDAVLQRCAEAQECLLFRIAGKTR